MDKHYAKAILANAPNASVEHDHYQRPRAIRGEYSISDPMHWTPRALAATAIGDAHYGSRFALAYRHYDAPLDRIGGPFWALAFASAESAANFAANVAPSVGLAEWYIYEWRDGQLIEHSHHEGAR